MGDPEDFMLRNLLDFDPLGQAEEITGSSYKDDEETTALGFALLQSRRKMVDAALLERGDTLFHNDLERYQFIIEDAGFEQVYSESFQARRGGHEEQYFIYWHPDGLLLAFDTYGGNRVNGANVHYNWRPQPNNDYWPRASSSPHCEDWDDPESPRTYAQSLDAREALLFNLTQLRENGEFLNPWLYEPMLWFLHHHGDPETIGRYGDPGYSQARDDAQANRIARLPEHVRTAIKVVTDGG